MDFEIENGVLIKCRGNDSEITIPDSVTSIGDNAFAFCARLKSITIPDSVTSIGAEAFEYCHSLTSVVISNSAKSIADGAFGYCISLTSIIINGNELKIDYQEIKNAGELITDAIGMLFKKDFSRKFSHKIKFKLIADYFFCTADEDAGAYLKKNAVRIIRQFIENNDIERIRAC
ncbi:MAG: leucine-rich repeat domain-containing protein [Ruminococcus sp.]|nr:leucine-rich repeat domain-containing protein [Ruminococcus sp.]